MLEELTTFWQRTAQSTEQAISVLRLHKSGPVTPLATLTLHGGPGLGVSTSVLLLAPGHVNFPTYEVSAADSSALTTLAADLQRDGVVKRPYVGNAIRRFSYAGDRSRDDDRILDLMISAESLFLGHLQDWHGELSFRLALHAAFFLGSRPSERRVVRALFKRAYDTRSAIVHRGAAPPSAWGSSSARPETLAAFTSDVEAAMRRALLKAVGIAKRRPTGGALVDWTMLVFREGE